MDLFEEIEELQRRANESAEWKAKYDQLIYFNHTLPDREKECARKERLLNKRKPILDLVKETLNYSILHLETVGHASACAHLTKGCNCYFVFLQVKIQELRGVLHDSSV